MPSPFLNLMNSCLSVKHRRKSWEPSTRHWRSIGGVSVKHGRSTGIEPMYIGTASWGVYFSGVFGGSLHLGKSISNFFAVGRSNFSKTWTFFEVFEMFLPRPLKKHFLLHFYLQISQKLPKKCSKIFRGAFGGTKTPFPLQFLLPSVK